MASMMERVEDSPYGMRVLEPYDWEYMRRDGENIPECPRFISWRLVLPHSKQALRNHGQRLERLSIRGGLSPDELVAVIEDRAWMKMTPQESLSRLMELINAS